jgi:integrase
MASKKISARIEHGISRIERPGRAPVYRVQLSGRKVGGQRLNRDCATYAEAQAQKRAWLETGGAATEGPGPALDDPTVEDGLVCYAADLFARGKTAEREKELLPALRVAAPALLACPIRSVAPGAIFAFRQAREAAGCKPNTIIRDLRVLRAMFNLMARTGVGGGGLITQDMFPPENLTRLRVLQPDDEARVFPLVPEPFRTMARLAALTLMRQAEIRTLERDMIHLEQGLILLPKTKSIPRAVVLGDEAVTLLARQIDRVPADARYVFANPRTGQPYSRVHVTRIWRTAARAAGLRNFTFHDLRHHGTTVAVNEGASDRVIMALGGWKNPKQIERYGFAAGGTLRAMANKIAGGLRVARH